MYDVVVEQEISAGHKLCGYRGKCENFHGHNWKVRVEVTSDRLDATGLALDFGILKEALRRILETYDHTMLNELPEFKAVNPTSENLARIIYGRCRDLLQAHPVKMKSVSVWESSKSFVRYYEP